MLIARNFPMPWTQPEDQAFRANWSPHLDPELSAICWLVREALQLIVLLPVAILAQFLL